MRKARRKYGWEIKKENVPKLEKVGPFSKKVNFQIKNQVFEHHDAQVREKVPCTQ